METFLFTPNIYNTGVLRALKPSTNVGDFTYSRTGGASRRNAQDNSTNVAENVSQIDHTGGGCPSLLLEPARTNLFTSHNNLSPTLWLKDNATITQENDPSIGTVVDRLTTPVTGGSFAVQNKSLTQGTFYTITSIVKAGTSNFCTLTALAVSGLHFFNFTFDIQNGVLGQDRSGVGLSAQGRIKSLNNGYYACSMTFEAQSNEFYRMRVGNAESVSNIIAPAGSSILIEGSQVEEGAFPTSIIPTDTSTETRGLPSVVNAGDVNTFNSQEGVLMFEASALENSGNFRLMTLSNNTTSNRVSLGYTPTDNQIRFEYRTNNASNLIVRTLSTPTDRHKIAIRYSATTFSAWVDGVMIGSAPVTVTPLADNILNVLNLNDGRTSSIAGAFEGRIRQIRYDNRALTDAEMVQLTTI